MSNKTTKRSTSSVKMATKKVKRSLPKNISKTINGTYRVRIESGNTRVDKTFSKLKEAKGFLTTIK